MNDAPLIIRADAGTAIGIGHVMRCLALGQAWQDGGGRVVFVMAAAGTSLKKRLYSEGMEVVDLPVRAGSADDAVFTAGIAHKVGAPWVTVDGYHFGAGYQRAVKDAGFNLLFMDDFGHAEHYTADLVLNQNLGAGAGMYAKREPYTRLLLGPRYVLLRREFQNWADWHRETVKVAHRILVTLGGADEDNATLKVLHALPQVRGGDLEAVVVIGASNPHRDELELEASNMAIPISIQTNVNNMPELMAWADVAVTAGGSTCWELAFMGLPGLILVLADNQRPVAERLGQMGAATSLGWHGDLSPAGIAGALYGLLSDPGLRAVMSERGRGLVDGKGAVRVIGKITNAGLQLRAVHTGDSNLLWKWANDPVIREASFSPEPIPWDKHAAWFASRLKDPECMFFIIEKDGCPCGQIRFDLSGAKAEISISISGGARGYGYGSKAIRMAVAKLFRETAINLVNAYIKFNNDISNRAFEKAGFRLVGEKRVKGIKSLHYIRHRIG